MEFTRRVIITGAALTLPAAAQRLIDLRLPGGPSKRPLEPAFPGKGEMIIQRIRAPVLETPMSVFDQGTITPNERFFVRWNWEFPRMIDAAGHRVVVRGAVKQPLQLTLDEIVRAGEHVEVTAVNQCAGNGRGFSQPRVTGTQWGNGAMGSARWTGVRLRDVLDKAGVGREANRIRFAGLDKPPIEGAPQFIKSIPIDVARRDDVLIAWNMNGEALPVLHGYPLRIVVPGWFSTYWVKMLNDIEVLTGEDDSYYVAKTYRMPVEPVSPSDKGFETVPITAMPPRAFITSHADGTVVKRGAPLELRGIAMGGHAGVEKVELDGGGLKAACSLGPEDGRLGFRSWSLRIPEIKGDLIGIGVRATNTTGASQPDVQAWNPSGYARYVVERISLTAA